MINTCIQLFDLTSVSNDWGIAADWLEDRGHPVAQVFRTRDYYLFDPKSEQLEAGIGDGSGSGSGNGSTAGNISGTAYGCGLASNRGDGGGDGLGFGDGSGSGSDSGRRYPSGGGE